MTIPVSAQTATIKKNSDGILRAPSRRPLTALFSAEQLAALRHTLELDPRPHYQNDATKVYGMPFCGHDIHFTVSDGVLTVMGISSVFSSST